MSWERSQQEQLVPATHRRLRWATTKRSPAPGAATISEPSFSPDATASRGLPAASQPTVIGHQHSHRVLPGVALKYRCVEPRNLFR
jgi:hypothetical protein